MQGKKFTRVFFATDIHGSETCFRKFLKAAEFYKADVLVLGGDITGKMVIPIVDLGNGTFKADYLGKEEIARTSEEIKRLEQFIANSGYYYHHCSTSEMDDLRSSKDKVNELFMRVMKETLSRWVDYAEQHLNKMGVFCYITGGNDDPQEVVDYIKDTEHLKNVDNKVVKIDNIHEMANLGYSNMTPWKCPRDISEEELMQRIEKLMPSVSDSANCVFNFHIPPKGCGLDTVVKLDVSFDPPKPVVEKGGEPVMIGAGSESVRHAVEKYQPLLHLCGHIHESRGVCNIGKTFVVNPGSEYTEGVLRGVIANVGNRKIVSWQLTSG